MSSHDVHQTLREAMEALAALRRSYERFWQHLERPEPVRERDRLRTVFQRLLQGTEGPSNTALAFRVRSAQQSFRAFDELCERRNRDPGIQPLAKRRESHAPLAASRAAAEPRELYRTVMAAPSPKPLEALYETLVAGLQKTQQPAPSKDKFLQQVEAYLARAQAEAPGATLQAEVSFDGQGRPKLVVVDVTR